MPRGVPAFTESAALTFGAATSDRVNLGSASSLDLASALTWIGWFYPTTVTNLRRLWTKGIGAGTAHSLLVSGTAGDLNYTRSFNTTALNYNTSDLPLVANRWCCVAICADFTIATGQCNMFWGTQTAPAHEASYSANTDGVGTVFDDSANNLVLGNRHSATFNVAFQGRIAAAAVFARRLSLTEVIAWQFSALDEPFPAVMAGCAGLWYPGAEGAGNVIDYSGYHNDGVVTGATLSRGVALPARNPWLDTGLRRSA